MKESWKIVEPTDCLDINLRLLKLGSLFPLDEVSSSKWINTLYKGYTTFTVTLFFSVSVAAPLFIFCTEYSLEDGIEVMSILLTQVRSGMKIMTFIIYRKEIQDLIMALYENFYIHGKELTADESSIIRETIKYARKMTIGYVTLYSITGLSMVLHPLSSVEMDVAQEDTLNHTRGAHRNLPFKSWYPNWDSTKSPEYEIEYLAQATLAILEAWCLGCMDTFCVTLMIHAGCQFDLLGISLRNISKNALLKTGTAIYERRIHVSYPTKILTLDNRSTSFVIPRKVENKGPINVNDSGCSDVSDESALQDNYTQLGWEEGNHVISTDKSYTQVEKETVLYIKECIRHHQALLTYVAEMNKCFSTMFFVVFLTASILICLLGFQVIVMPPKGLMFVRVLLHSISTVLELAFFCWFGSEVLHKSQNLHQAAYDSDWQSNCSEAKQLICMIITRAQRPAAVQAGLFGDICLPTFSSLMRNAYSYLALLRQFHEEDSA